MLTICLQDPKDTFEDIPLDTRHHEFKSKPKFPVEWRMTEERQKQLQTVRAEAKLIDIEKRATGQLVNGLKRIDSFLTAPPKAASEKVAELVEARARPKAKAPIRARR
jgi:small subunit ribosomal protein S35